MKHLVGKNMTKKIEFMGDEVEIRMLSVAQVYKLQELVKRTSKSKSEEDGLKSLFDVVRLAVVDADTLTDDDMKTFPIAELNKLSEQILEVSGLGSKAGN